MSDEIYHKLAKILDTLPNGFPATDSGIEIKILKKVFTPEEADLFCDLRLTPETAEQIANRTGRPIDGLEQKLISMWERGEIDASNLEEIKKFKMMPWILGIYEFQNHRMDKEFAKMCEEYSMHWGAQFVSFGPQLMQVIPIEKEIPVKQEALPYQQVSNLIENAKSFMVTECICKKNQGLLDNPCEKPTEVCMGMDPEPGFYDNHPWGGRVISREEAYEVLRKAEEAGLVHMTSNLESGHGYICNCCGCCCGLLRAANMGIPNVVNSHYYAQIDPDICDACGTCAEERCQVNAIEEGEEAYKIIKEKCIGCGLCVSSCPSEAIQLIHKKPEELVYPVKDEEAWFEERARQRGVDYNAYR
ncbi:MAG: 4Fe-4S binding protein [Desulfobacterales bacterium]|jgi:NAD-dependent dihydropyrimidine dehydrogenase PreA subunit